MLVVQTQKKRKVLKTYYKTYEITTLKKHVDTNHVLIVKIFEKGIMVQFLKKLKCN